jgi:hypothetical protein
MHSFQRRSMIDEKDSLKTVSLSATQQTPPSQGGVEGFLEDKNEDLDSDVRCRRERERRVGWKTILGYLSNIDTILTEDQRDTISVVPAIHHSFALSE